MNRHLSRRWISGLAAGALVFSVAGTGTLLAAGSHAHAATTHATAVRLDAARDTVKEHAADVAAGTDRSVDPSTSAAKTAAGVTHTDTGRDATPNTTAAAKPDPTSTPSSPDVQTAHDR